jgi:hypothetical protein
MKMELRRKEREGAAEGERQTDERERKKEE